MYIYIYIHIYIYIAGRDSVYTITAYTQLKNDRFKTVAWHV